VIGQWFNLFLTKHRYRYPHGWDIFRNKATYLGMLASGTISSVVVFVPALQSAFNTETVVAVAMASPFAAGVLLVLYEYPRRYVYFRMKGINKGLK
jgi:magnesium-transporting ATPase (P-type)